MRRACALPYELSVDGKLNDDKTQFTIGFAAGNEVFGEHRQGRPSSFTRTCPKAM